MLHWYVSTLSAFLVLYELFRNGISWIRYSGIACFLILKNVHKSLKIWHHDIYFFFCLIHAIMSIHWRKFAFFSPELYVFPGLLILSSICHFRLQWFSRDFLTHFKPLNSFYTLWIDQKNLWFSDIFTRYRKRLVAWNGFL